MTVAALQFVSPSRRDAVFNEIRNLVSEIDACDRSLGFIHEGWSVDDALEEIIMKLNAELRCNRKRRRKSTRLVAKVAHRLEMKI
jgi:hypothetical protein